MQRNSVENPNQGFVLGRAWLTSVQKSQHALLDISNDPMSDLTLNTAYTVFLTTGVTFYSGFGQPLGVNFLPNGLKLLFARQCVLVIDEHVNV